MTKKYTLSAPSLSVTYTAQSLEFDLKTLDSAGGTSTVMKNLGFALEQGFFVHFLELLDSPTVSDAEVRAFFKTLTDNAAAVDAAALAFSTFRADTAATSDEKVFATFKALADVTTVSDTSSKSVGKPKTDAATVTDGEINTVGKTLSDTGNLTDYLDPFVVGKSIAETPTAQEAYAAAMAKTFADAGSASDAPAKNLFRTLTSVAYATDDLDGDASILDDQEMQFVKTRTDMVTVSETITVVRTFHRNFNETPQFTDAGSLRSQGYADFTYFEGDFVGASRTF